VVFENHRADSRDDSFDADAAIATGELAKLIPDLIDALGGEMTLGDAQALPGAAPGNASATPH
jgi:recombination associated protein RdgC